MSCVLMIQIHQRIDFKTILPMMITTMIVQYFSTGYLFHFTDHSLKIILGIIMIFFAAMFAFPHKHWPEKIPTVFHILADGITGICGSLGVGGPPMDTTAKYFLRKYKLYDESAILLADHQRFSICTTLCGRGYYRNHAVILRHRQYNMYYGVDAYNEVVP